MKGCQRERHQERERGSGWSSIAWPRLVFPLLYFPPNFPSRVCVRVHAAQLRYTRAEASARAEAVEFESRFSLRVATGSR